MFEGLTERLSKTFRNLTGTGKLTESNMADALKEVRSALLSADVHFKVAREFIEKVKESCVGQDVLTTVSPGQQVVKIINDELVELLGGEEPPALTKRPLKILMVGLHGSGKTTSTAKLAKHLAKKENYRPHLIACDVYRPAAIDQLETLAESENFKSYSDRNSKDVPAIAKAGLKQALNDASDLVIFDTAGRLQIDEDLIAEVIKVKDTINPDETFLVADSALGQEAVKVAKAFHEAVPLTGIILTKLDGDARGGAALSMKHVTGVPIRFAGLGEKIDDFDAFHPDRMASRILGMGDVVSLVEKAQETIDEKEAEKMAKKMQSADFNLEDFLSQMQQVKKLGSFSSLAGMMPGMSGVEIGDKEDKKMKQTEAIIQSMTRQERRNPNLLNGSRRLRIAKGSGTKIKDVNQLLKGFGQMRKVMKKMRGGKGMKMMEKMMGGMPNLPGGKM
jgi:signal recognition particle subunit SRP54